MTKTERPQTVAQIRAEFVRNELDKGKTAEQAAERWASYAAGPGYTYLRRIAAESR